MHFRFVMLPTRVSHRDDFNHPVVQLGKLSCDLIYDFHDRELAELHFPLEFPSSSFAEIIFMFKIVMWLF